MPSQELQKFLSPDPEAIMLSEASDTRETNVRDYLRILRRRKWFVIAPLLIIVPIVVMLQAVKKPMYEAKFALVIEHETPKFLSVNKETPEPDRTADLQRMQIEIIQSHPILEQVVDALRLYDRPKNPAEDSPLGRAIKAATDFSESMYTVAMDWVRPLIDASRPSDTNNDTQALEPRRQKAIEQLQRDLHVEPRNSTPIIDISLRSSNADQAAQQVQLIVDMYLQQDQANKLVESKKAIAWLETKAEDLKKKIQNAEINMQDFRKKNEFVSLADFELAQNIVSQTATSIQSSFEELTSEKKNLQRRIDELKNAMTMSKGNPNYIERSASIFESLSDGPNVAVITSLRNKYLELQIQYANLSKKFDYKHPKLLEIKTEMNEIVALMHGEMQKSLDNMQKKYKMVADQEATLKSRISTQKSNALNVTNTVTEYSKLKNNMKIDKELYLTISQRLAEITLAQALETDNIRILSNKPVLKRLPSGRVGNMLIGTMCALGLGIGLALLVDRVDDRMKSVDEVERELGAPFLALLPRYQANRSRPVTLYQPKSSVAEDYRELRTWVSLSSQTSLQSLMLTSAVPGEGKSLTAANLAIAFAQLGKRVVVIDADLRRPSIHLIFQVENEAGLTDILARGAQWQQLLQNTAMENLKVLPSGGQPHNPSELLHTNRLENLLAALKSAFDMIIIDAPVTLSCPDVPIMASVTDGVLFVYSPGKSDKAAMRECKKILTRAGAHIVGVVANNINPQEQRGYYYNTKYQGYQHYTDDTSSTPRYHASRGAGNPGFKRYADDTASTLRRFGVIDVDFVDMRPELPEHLSSTDDVYTSRVNG